MWAHLLTASYSNYKVLTRKLNVVQHLFLSINKKLSKTNNQYIYTLQRNSSIVNCKSDPSNKGTDCFTGLKIF